ncbi:MAG: ABC transporter substrate-binding protein [Oceanipulchritudo sp.]
MRGAGSGRSFWTRRRFFRGLGALGLLVSGCGPRGRKEEAALGGDELSEASANVEGSPANLFLKEMRKVFSGRRLRVLTEDTPPSVASHKLVGEEFSRLTGIEVEWLLLPLEQVYARTQVDTAQQSGHHDVFYLDQSWLGQFSPHMEDLNHWRSLLEFGYPYWEWQDFMRPLIRHTASYLGNNIAIPYDITLFIGMYRRDVFEELGLHPPTNLVEYLHTAQVIDKALAPAVRGTTGQLQVGHYALLCHFSAWLWGHGGSFFHADGTPSLDEPEAHAALEYLMELRRCMPGQVIGWDWHGESKSFARGEAGFYSSWAEFFPMYDDPALSEIVGLAEPMAMPGALHLKAPSECGFGETPGVSHQGGSGIGISRYSREKEASWIFLQWLTSSDVAVRACLLGGGASATRHSVFSDPRIRKRNSIVGPGTTRHFPVMRDAILNRMGTEPHHPDWPSLALYDLPVELGKLVTGQQGIRDTARALNRVAGKKLHGRESAGPSNPTGNGNDT